MPQQPRRSIRHAGLSHHRAGIGNDARQGVAARSVRRAGTGYVATTGRTIVLRHAPPDDAIFLILDFPAATDTMHARDSVHVRVHPVAGTYAFELVTTDKLPGNSSATFSYAVHFRAPAGASVKYPSAGKFEQALAPAELGAANKVQFIGGVRPAADVVRFPVAAAGSYALVAAR